jgi:sulfur carrier protein ThiS adenylyltransferase
MNINNIHKILQNKRVGIAGVGGLGSNCAIALARAGIGIIRIVDFDIVSKPNLNRQYYFRRHIGQKKVDALREIIYEISDNIEIESIDKKINSKNVYKLFENSDIIIEALDDAKEKQSFIENCLYYFPDKPIVSGMGLALWGKIKELKVSKFENLYICGDMTNEVGENSLPFAPRVAIVANMQADMVLELLLK